MNCFITKYLSNVGTLFLTPIICLFFSESVLGQNIFQNKTYTAESETEYIWYHQEHPMGQPAHSVLNSIFFLDKNTGWAVGREEWAGSILNTTDGGETWNLQLMFDEYSVNHFSSVHFVDENHGWVVGRRNNNMGVILSTDDGGNTWNEQYNDAAYLTSVFFTDPLNGWAVSGTSSTGGIDIMLRTQDGGQNWSHISITGLGWLRISDIQFLDSETGWASGWIVGDGGIILHTSDGGESWTTQADNLERDLRSIHFVDSNNGWAVGDVGRIYHTDNGGLNWQNQTNQEFTTYLNSVSFADTNTGWAVGGSTRYTFLRTDDGGDNWYVYETGWTMEPRSVFFIDHETGWVAGSGSSNIMHYTEKIYPGVPELTSPADQVSGVNYPVTFEWQSSDDTDYYQFQLSRNSDFAFGVESVDNITDTQYTRDLYLHYDTEYFWRVRAKNIMAESDWSDVFTFTSGDGTSTSTEPIVIPAEFTLAQNYPNPFNPTTVIVYSLPITTEVKLEVYNLKGQRVATLVNEQKSAGWHTVSFDASNLASGMYIYRIVAGEYVQTQKLTLVK